LCLNEDNMSMAISDGGHCHCIFAYQICSYNA